MHIQGCGNKLDFLRQRDVQQVYLQATLRDIRIYKRFRLSQIFAVEIALHLNISRDRDQ